MDDALRSVGAKSRAPLNKLVNDGLVFVEETERGEQDLIILEAAPDRVEKTLASWRGTAIVGRLLGEIIELVEPPTMAEAQRLTGATRSMLNKLVKVGALELREEQVWRDSLRDYDFVPDSAPKLTADQQKGLG